MTKGKAWLATIWLLWFHFNVWGFLLIVLTSAIIGWTSDIDGYKEQSEIFTLDVATDTFSVRENRFFPHVFISEFQGIVAGDRKYFAVYFYPGPMHRKPTAVHQRLFAVINKDEFASLGRDKAQPIPILKYGVSSAMENFDYGFINANITVPYDVYTKNVASYLKDNKAYFGISMDFAFTIFLRISVALGVGCGIYSAVSWMLYRPSLKSFARL